MQENQLQRDPIPPPDEPVISEVPQAMPLRILQGAVGGLLGAIVGGIIWGLILQLTEYEVGYVAWGIGLLCGWAVGFFSSKGKGTIFQLIAVFFSVFGILIGKYYGFFIFLKEYITLDYGAEAAAEVSIFSLDVILLFVEYLTDMVNLYDLVFVGLAIYTAWRMLRKEPPISQVKVEGS
jgi:hypothetical protein